MRYYRFLKKVGWHAILSIFEKIHEILHFEAIFGLLYSTLLWQRFDQKMPQNARILFLRHFPASPEPNWQLRMCRKHFGSIADEKSRMTRDIIDFSENPWNPSFWSHFWLALLDLTVTEIWPENASECSDFISDTFPGEPWTQLTT